ncbi:hypothetical protein BDV59DRAFT_53505 [Aspergillus ambiguus]|uniref:uncharacterized protein n=1 Tax=Aspergillus ambiguus TaxID=176160 RepID=UPI003CCD2022
MWYLKKADYVGAVEGRPVIRLHPNIEPGNLRVNILGSDPGVSEGPPLFWCPAPVFIFIFIFLPFFTSLLLFLIFSDP